MSGAMTHGLGPMQPIPTTVRSRAPAMCVVACAHRAGARARAHTMIRPVLHLLLLIASAISIPADEFNSLPMKRQLHLFGWHLELEENEAMQSPDFKECQFYKGRVSHEPGSTAMVTECSGDWYGLLQVSDEIFVLPPKQQSSEGEHVLHRRDVLLALMSEKVPVYNLTNDIEGDNEEDSGDMDSVTQKARIHTRSSHATHEDFFRSDVPVIRPGSRLWLEMAIVADHTMTKFHGDKVQHYILALMNIVSAIFNDRSLGANMTLVINKLLLLEKPDIVVQDGDISETLKRVNKWNKRHLLKIPTENGRWDALVWLTRSDLGGPSGLARMNSVCSLNSSTVQRDEGFTSAFVIAHELGHLLGLHHDDKASCGPKGRASTVMSPVVRASLEFTWSSCSRNQFHIKSRKWSCLHQRSGAAGLELVGSPRASKYSYFFTMEHQCRVEFGEGFSVCKVKMESPLCSNLYCAHHSNPGTCYSKNTPPLEGTTCKKHHRCLGGECRPSAGYPHKQWESPKPQWEAWQIGACDAHCGYGLRVDRRRCLGESSRGGCPGAGTRFESCWSGKLCAQTKDERAELCRRVVSEFIPYIHDDASKHCQLWCVNRMGGDPSVFGSLPDGTACSYNRPYDICYRGECLQGNCNASDPACNWCPNGQCHNYTYSGTRPLQNGWTSLLEIPQETRRFSVHIATPVQLELAIRIQNTQEVYRLRNHSKQHKVPMQLEPADYLKYDVNVPQNLRIVDMDNWVRDFGESEGIALQGKVAAAGTVIEWQQMEMDVFITSESQAASGITILVASETQNGMNEEVYLSFNFSFPHSNALIRPRGSRRRDRVGPCSVSCGGGIRLVKHRCQPGQTCKPFIYEACNLHRCEFTWHPGDWEECSQTCGDGGHQERQMFCVPDGVGLSSRRDLVRHSVSPALCRSSSQPPKQQPCNQLPCPVYWQEMPWTQCSTTCGPGEKHRPLVCPAEDDMFCGPKPRERRQKCHLRHRCPYYRRSSRWPDNNTLQSCDLVMPSQKRSYCKIPFFRKHCGRTCLKIDT